MNPRQNCIAERILDCFPSGTYAIGALLQLMDIVETREIATAAVECRMQPRLLINPDFVATWAATPEKLLMLVMHELHHVLLGHTRLFPCATRVDNLVFDAVINALLCRMFPDPAHTSFFTGFYDDAEFPACLLRPPTGWTPARYPVPPRALRRKGMRGIAAIHRALYSEKGATYHDVFDVLRLVLTEAMVEAIVLLGDHSRDGSVAGQLGVRSSLVFDTVRRIVERWPQPPDPIQGRSFADLLQSEHVTPERKLSNTAILYRLFRRIAVACAQGRGMPLVGTAQFPVTTPIPTFDRRSVVLGALGTPNILHGTEISHRRRTLRDQVHVYVDVSGSITGALKAALYGTVLGCREFVFPRVHLFSTQVADVTLAQLRNGECKSTGGTDIACVADHMRRNKVRRAVILTDGYVGSPTGADSGTLSQAALGVALTPGTSTRGDLQEVAGHWAELN
jgi:hypothetical protein